MNLFSGETIDWHNQYLVLPLEKEIQIKSQNPENDPNKVLISKDSDPTKTYIDIDVNIDLDLWKEWMGVRRKKKAINSNTALKALIKILIKIEKNGVYTANFAMEKAIEKSWRSVKIEWLDNLNDESNTKNRSGSKKTSGAAYIADDIINL